jgi:hypothetical protein
MKLMLDCRKNSRKPETISVEPRGVRGRTELNDTLLKYRHGSQMPVGLNDCLAFAGTPLLVEV